MTTKLMSKNSKSYTKTHRGCASEEPDEGNLQVRFCEGAHSNLGAITSTKGAIWALLDITRIRTDTRISVEIRPIRVIRVPGRYCWILYGFGLLKLFFC
jgi:hypothetical protein